MWPDDKTEALRKQMTAEKATCMWAHPPLHHPQRSRNEETCWLAAHPRSAPIHSSYFTQCVNSDEKTPAFPSSNNTEGIFEVKIQWLFFSTCTSKEGGLQQNSVTAFSFTKNIENKIARHSSSGVIQDCPKMPSWLRYYLHSFLRPICSVWCCKLLVPASLWL